MTYQLEPKLLRPTASLRGNGGRGSEAIALVTPGVSTLTLPPDIQEEYEKKPVVLPKKEKPPKSKHAQPVPQPQPAVADKNLRPGMPGYILGSATSGAISDHDVRIALPIHAPDPPIVRAKLPEWISGDVIVEVTISENGEVVDTVAFEKQTRRRVERGWVDCFWREATFSETAWADFGADASGKIRWALRRRDTPETVLFRRAPGFAALER
jgi:hypothetical protein